MRDERTRTLLIQIYLYLLRAVPPDVELGAVRLPRWEAIKPKDRLAGTGNKKRCLVCTRLRPARC